MCKYLFSIGLFMGIASITLNHFFVPFEFDSGKALSDGWSVL